MEVGVFAALYKGEALWGDHSALNMRETPCGAEAQFHWAGLSHTILLPFSDFEFTKEDSDQ